MGVPKSTRGLRGRSVFVVTVLGVGLMVVGGLVFAMSAGSAELVTQARALHGLDEGLRLVTAVRAQVGLGVHLAAIEEAYSADVDAALERSASEGREALDLLQGLAASEGWSGSDVGEAVDGFVSLSSELLRLVESDEVASARELAQDQLDGTYEAAATALNEARGLELAAVAAGDRLSARLGDAGRFAVVLVIPLGLVFGYREIVARQLRQRELEMRLSAERELAKARDEFVANASHELRTPLTAIYGLGQVLEEDPTIPDEAREMLRMMNTEAADLSRMVEDLLTTARLAAGQLRYEPRRVETAPEAETIVQPFVQAGNNVQVEVERSLVLVDRLRQRQVLRNLISNAVKYGGGSIRLGGRVEKGWYRWTVADDGPGVPKELEERLFQRYIHTLTFQQAVAGGVGLGLSIVKSLAEGMGGSVDYRRSQGWTEFIVRVPLAPADGGDRGIGAPARLRSVGVGGR